MKHGKTPASPRPIKSQFEYQDEIRKSYQSEIRKQFQKLKK